MSSSLGQITSSTAQRTTTIPLQTFSPQKKEEEVSNHAQMNHEATTAKFNESATIRQGMEPQKKETFFYRIIMKIKDTHADIVKHPFHLRMREKNFTQVEFKEYLKDQNCIFKALEVAEEKIKDYPHGHFVLPEVRRSEALKKDLEDWVASNENASEEANKYANYLKALEDPDLVIAHMFVNYGGVLNGGQRHMYFVHEVFAAHMKSCNQSAEIPKGVAYYTFESSCKSNWEKHFNELPEKVGIRKENLENFETKLATESIKTYGLLKDILNSREKKTG
jgi:heme oxygenase